MPNLHHRHRLPLLVSILTALLLSAPSLPAASPERLCEAYREITEEGQRESGLLDVYRHEGHVYLALAPEDLDRDYLLSPTIARGVAAGRILGGMQWESDDWVLRLRRRHDKVVVLRKNIRFVATGGGPLAEAVRSAYSDSVIAALTIHGESSPAGLEEEDVDGDDEEDEAVDEDLLLIRLDELLLSDLLDLGSSLSSALGAPVHFVRELSSWGAIHAYPANLGLRADLTYRASRSLDAQTVPDRHAVSLTVYYNLARLPETDFVPRPADDRVGYFLTTLRDHSRGAWEGPFVRLIKRWNLVKADPDEPASPPAEPLVFWLEDSIPYAFRPWIREGILEWNRAFEAVGIRGAIEVRTQTDRDSFDPEDVEHTTLRWGAEAPFNASAPSRAHPLTGEIFDADILYSHSALRSFRIRSRLFEATGEEEEEEASHRCTVQEDLAEDLTLLSLVRAAGDPGLAPGELPMEFLGPAVRKTVMHEMGHVLGLRHNFKSSTVVPNERLHDVEWTRKHGLTGSIMDYVPVNIAPEGVEQGEYFSSTLGPYDYWAIEYGYADLSSRAAEASKGDAGGDADEEETSEDPGETTTGPGVILLDEAELEALDAIASRAAEPELAFGTDEDRADRSHYLDPMTAVYDLGDSPLDHAIERLGIVRSLWDEVLERFVPEGRSYALARLAVNVLCSQIRRTTRLTVPYVGGLHHHRDHRGDPGERPTFVPVPAEEQRRALRFLADGLFAPETYELPRELLERLAPSHWQHWGAEPPSRMDFPFHGVVLRLHTQALESLLEPKRLRRLMDAKRVLPEGADLLTVPELFRTLSRAVFQELEVAGPWEGSRRAPFLPPIRRNLQRAWVGHLGELLHELPSTAATDGPAMARQELRWLEGRLAEWRGRADRVDAVSRAHLADLRARVDQELRAETVERGF